MPRLFPRAACALLGFALMVGCAREAPKSSETPPAPVTVAKAQRKTVPVQLKAIGTVRVYKSVAVRPEVTGELKTAHFTEGRLVTKGQELFTVDPVRYKTALEHAQALLERERAVLRGAELALKRGLSLPRTSVTAEDIEKLRTDVAAATASVAANVAAVRTAEIQRDQTTIRSPIDGQTGNLLVAPGNLVTANEANPLVVINQLKPISVSFAVPEEYLGDIEEGQAQMGRPLTVEAYPRERTPVTAGKSPGKAKRHGPLTGELTFIDNTVDPATGTIQLKGDFTNDDLRLWPGRYVDVVLTLGERPDSVVVPAAAVQDGQDERQYVFVVRPDSTAELRYVTVAFVHAGEAVIAEGLAAGETVVTDGHLRVAPGGQVKPRGDDSQP